MAAFSQLHHPFLLDSVFLQNTPIKMYGFVDEGNSNININTNTNTNANTNTNTTFFSPYYTSDHQQHLQETPVDVGIHESRSCLENSSSKAVYSDNETSVTKKLNSTDSSSMVDKLESGEQQVTQKLMTSTMDKKRKNRDGSSLSSAQSKDAREGKGRKQRKCNGGQSDVEVKNTKLGGKKDQKNVGEEAPSGYIHVRARRGQATDSHSLAERVRREKISERMKLLQALVPGCDKVTGKALMLDEIINYVQSLQNQVEFLSMKLASLNPMIYDFGVDPDAFMVRPSERLSGLASPLPSSVQQCSPTQTTAIADTVTTTTTTFTTPPTNHYSLLDPSFLLQQGQRLNPFTQDNGSLLWDVDGQKQKFINQSGLISNNMCSFH